jgi:hypothetical protein
MLFVIPILGESDENIPRADIHHAFHGNGMGTSISRRDPGKPGTPSPLPRWGGRTII